MSHVAHKSICITSWDQMSINECRKKLIAIGLGVTKLHESKVNGYHTFFVIPSGSKAGWDDANCHDSSIAVAREVIDSYASKDGSNRLECSFPVYGDFEG